MTGTMTQEPVSRVITTSGPRSAERALLDLVESLRPRRPSELGEPVRVVVPSRALRVHVAARLVAAGRPLAGVVVETLGGLARGLLAHSSAPARPAEAALGVLTRRFAAEEPALASSLGGLSDPFSAVVAPVRDLLDAGLGPASVEPALELLAGLDRRRAREDVLVRAAAVVRVASRVETAARRLGVDLGSRVLARASEALASGAALPARSVVVHGFADVTGVAGDLLDNLMRRGALVIVDLPPDPAGGDAGAFASRLLERLSRSGTVGEPRPPGQEPRLHMVPAADREAEAREVAERVRALLDGGAVPERVAVVAREVGPPVSPLVRHLERLGVPFSGDSLAAPGGDLRVRLAGLLEVVAAGGRATVDRWREAASGLDASFEVAAALRVLGATRLADLTRLEPPRGGVRLPLAAGPDDEDDENGGLEPVRVEAAQLAAQRDAARTAVALLGGWPGSAAASAHALRTAELVELQGGWPADAEEALHEALERCVAELSPLGPVSRTEWVSALAWAARELSRVGLGGAGGGIQVLGAMEARGRTFEHLFVIGLQRDAFPRQVRQEPLLPDEVRARLAAVLPEIPVKARGFLEERYLFAQLASAAPEVTLSWAAGGTRGASPASPFVEELKALYGAPEAIPRGTLAGSPATAWEHAVSGGLAANRGAWTAALPAALAEGWSRLHGEVPDGTEAAARALAQALEELERPDADAGPFFGLLGLGSLGADGSATVTGLEATARCPWQAFVTRVLRVAPMDDPLLALPTVDRRLVGIVVHEVLAARAAACGAARETDLSEAVRREPAELLQADEAWLDRALARAAAEAVRREGVPFPGFAAVLALLARPYASAALDLDEGAGVLAAEVDGTTRIGGTELHFRADRVDAGSPGPSLTDYKTGRPRWTRLKQPASRRRALLDALGRGELLQAAAYAASLPGAGGRYLYLGPGGADDGVEVGLAGDDGEAAAGLEAAVGVIARAVAAGVAVPRTSRNVTRRSRGDGSRRVELRPSPWCRSCRVREACVRDDSGLRGRHEAWLAEPEESGLGAERAARAVWRLGAGADREDE